MKLLDIIEEQVASNVANSAYNEVVKSVSGIGTNLSGFLAGMNMLRNARDFQLFSSLFKDKKTGYGSFIEMINDEFDRFDYNTIQKLRKKLLSIGVDTTFKYSQSNGGQDYFDGQFRIVSGSKVKPCNTYSKVLPQAIKYWKDWLSSPITKKKFRENWAHNPLKNVDSIFEEYLEALNGIQIEYYNKQSSDSKITYAYVNNFNPSKIFVNCEVRDPYPLDTLVHEIQHTLYNIHPLNPDKKIGSLFVGEKTKRDKITDFFTDIILGSVNPLLPMGKEILKNNIKNPTQINTSTEIDYDMVSRKTGIEPRTLQLIWLESMITDKKERSYACKETEKMSNIMSIRKYFNLKPGQKVTYQMLKNEMDKDNPQTDVRLFVLCWALNGFKDGLLTKMNDLAYQKTGSNKTNNSV
jgi:hypothetical protein